MADLGSSKKTGLKKVIFDGTIKLYVQRTWTIDGIGFYVQAHDEARFNRYLNSPSAMSRSSIVRGFGYHKKNLITAVRLALKNLKENPQHV